MGCKQLQRQQRKKRKKRKKIQTTKFSDNFRATVWVVGLVIPWLTVEQNMDEEGTLKKEKQT